MSKVLPEDILSPIRELITEMSGFTENTEYFNHILKCFTTKLKKSDTMYFLNKRDIDQVITSMSEKFCFHGFFLQAQALKSAYEAYIPYSLSKAESMSRSNMVKFLICMSKSPTNYFLEHPDMFISKPVEPIEEVNWAEYLNEGISRWKPNFDESSDEASYSSFDECDSKELLSVHYSDAVLPLQIKSSENMYVMDYKTNREELLATIQHSWYNEEKFEHTPESDYREANIGILWENYLKDQVHGLILLRSPSFISEYKVIREILWQLWCPHNSTTLELSGRTIRPRPDVTLPSVRSYAFYTFMGEFLQYIDLLDYFRNFEKTLQYDLDQNGNMVCRTYQSYCQGLNSIIKPIFKKLCDVEDEVRKQETTFTLLRLANELRKIFEPLKILKEIHDDIILYPFANSPLKCSTTLIAKLHETLHFTTNKQEQDLRIALFLESIYHYFALIDSWFIRDDWVDYTEEFVIKKNDTEDISEEQFSIRKGIDTHYQEDKFLKVFLEKVLKIGRNIHFLRLLRKYDIIGDCQETIYDEFLRKTLTNLRKIYNIEEDQNTQSEDNEDINVSESFIYPVVGTETCKTIPDAEKLENLIDTADGFLMSAFVDFFIKKPKKKRKKQPSLYERISEITTDHFPKNNFFENILSSILDDRFTVSGLMVKNLLIEEHLLEKQFQFLKHLYLFLDDIIFPFYRMLFEKTETSNNKNWANDVWLTSSLQDIFMDMYPEFYEKCSIQVKDGSLCTDSLSACSLVNLSYEIPWPLNAIIRQEHIDMYKVVFQFVLKLKWALYTLNHLVFTDLEPKKLSTMKAQKTFKTTHHKNKITAKLILLKFHLTNVLNSLQHFIFGFLFSKNLQKFELEFEKAYDLNSLIESHSQFIHLVYEKIVELQVKMVEKDKLNNILNCVKLLKLMWTNLKYANLEKIKDCQQMYEDFYKDISPVIFPLYIYDY